MNKHYRPEPYIHRVASLKIVGDYTLELTFDDQTERTIDFAPILFGPLFGELRELEKFSQVRLDEDFGTLEWPNGADIAPNVLYNWPEHVEAIIERRQQKSAIG